MRKKNTQPSPDAQLERDLLGNQHGVILGIDEVGRGPWAGPVVACAVALDLAHLPTGINDSKALRPAQREARFAELIEAHNHGRLWYGIGEASVEEIDQLNILHATMLAMQRAYAALNHQCPHPVIHALIDGNRCPVLPCPTTAIVGGDGRSISIAAASIIAKTIRDRHMAKLAEAWPGYGFERHAGYGTPEHKASLALYGPTPHHRRSFAPVKSWIEHFSEDAPLS